MFLTRQQLRELTGTSHKSKQLEWLADRQYAFELDRNGRPVVLRSHVEQKLGGGSAAPASSAVSEPDWGALCDGTQAA